MLLIVSVINITSTAISSTAINNESINIISDSNVDVILMIKGTTTITKE